ncbi:HlyD family efflux transporter periplasmic adaptor subunit [Sutterella sp. AM18-8-1]|jgi:HlyD family secretion protein|nr:HlyD family efflux transporter periplasmic adaptor subunit [Sutterella sp. AM18-8-1]
MSEEEKKNAAPAPAAEAESGAAAAPTPQSLGKGPGKKALLKPLIVFAVLIAVGTTFMVLGPRRDADTLAQSQKYGTLTAEDVNTAFEKVSGKLVSRPAVEGRMVKAGDVLMELDSTDTDISIAKTKAQIAENAAAVEEAKRTIETSLTASGTTEKNSWRTIEGAKANLDSAIATEKRAKADYDRAKNLITSHAISQASFDSARNTWETAAAAVTTARKQLDASTVGASKSDLARLAKTGSAQGMRLAAIADTRASIETQKLKVKQLEAEGEQLKQALAALEVEKSRLTIKAPEDGKILKVMYQVGEIVPAGSPAVLLESNRQYYEIYVSEKDAAKFAEGKTVKGETAAGKTVTGTVRVLHEGPAFADLRGTRERGQADLKSLVARIYVTPQPGVIPGMSIGVKIND